MTRTFLWMFVLVALCGCASGDRRPPTQDAAPATTHPMDIDDHHAPPRHPQP